jgi:uncharacterized membrane protein
MNQLRLGLAIAGFIVALLSVALDSGRLGWAAIALLSGSLLLRILLRQRANPKSGGDGPCDASHR